MANQLDQICARFRRSGYTVERLENTALIKAKQFVIKIVCDRDRGCIITHTRRLES